jgi:CRISPR-associated protein Cas1
MLESPQITLTTSLLAEIAAKNIAVFSCDAKHLPVGVYTAFQPHSRQWRIMKAQIGMSKPFAKQCWKLIIEQKILNQAACLKIWEKPGSDELKKIAQEVKSADATNREAYAARLYFQYLCEGFRRHQDDVINASLNYGYAILRGAIARTLVAYGFMPAMGIHHCNELNKFNLADDFIEVFRPAVDLWTWNNITEDMENLDKKYREGLIKLLHMDMVIKEKRQSILRCIEQTVASFSTACLKKDISLLELPELIPLTVHRYE